MIEKARKIIQSNKNWPFLRFVDFNPGQLNTVNMELGTDRIEVRDRMIVFNEKVLTYGQPFIHQGKFSAKFKHWSFLGITVKFVDNWVLVDSALGIRARVGKGVVVVTASPEHFGATRGLCGNFNGQSSDDFLDISGKQAVRAELFATRKVIFLWLGILYSTLSTRKMILDL